MKNLGNTSILIPDSFHLDRAPVLPTISVVASASDLKAYRSDNISESEFQKRLDINSVDVSDEPEKDLKVMAGIIETAFEDTGKLNFCLRGAVDYMTLDNFGALFSFDVPYAGPSHLDFSDLQKSLEAMRVNLEKARVRMDDLDVDIEVRDTMAAKQREGIEAKRAEEKENIKKAYDQFITDLKSTIADYGRTLRSIESDQQILVTVTLSGRYEEIPERIDLQVRKSALDNNAREQVMAEIRVREH
jgi:hypothetical protein